MFLLWRMCKPTFGESGSCSNWISKHRGYALSLYSQRSRYGANPEQAKHHMKSGPWKMWSTHLDQHQSKRGRRYLEHRENGFVRSPASSMSFLSSPAKTVFIGALGVVRHNPHLPSWASLSMFEDSLLGVENSLFCGYLGSTIPSEIIYMISVLHTRAKALSSLYTDSPECDVSQVWDLLSPHWFSLETSFSF